jgi:hypothetical protein
MRRTLAIGTLWIATVAAAVGGTTAVLAAGDASGTSVLKQADVTKRLAAAGPGATPAQPTQSTIKPPAGTTKLGVSASKPAQPGVPPDTDEDLEDVATVYVRCLGGKVDLNSLRVVPVAGWNTVSVGGNIYGGAASAMVAFKKPSTGWVTIFWVACGRHGGLAASTQTF